MIRRHGLRTALQLTLALVVGSLALWVPPHASAACHSFTISGSTVKEGEPSTVTVSRDNTLDDSAVQIRTSNQTAKAPPDYEATIARVEFTNEASRTVEIPTAEDKVPEETETFQVKLGSAQGCRSFNTDYQYGPPATVTIKDDDAGAPPIPTVKPTAEPTERPRATATPEEETPSPSPKETPSPTPTETPEETLQALPTLAPEDDEDSLNAGLIAVAVGAFVLACVLALLLTRAMRTR